MSGRIGRCWPAWACCLLFLFTASAPLLAQHRAELIQLPAQGVVGDLKQSATVRPDPAGELHPEALLRSDEGFEPYSPDLERNAPPLWLKLRLTAPPQSDGQYVLRVARRFFQAFEVHMPDEDGQLREFRAAYDEAVTMDTVGRQFVSGFTVPPGEIRTLLIRVDTVQDSLQPVELWIESRSTFAASKTNNFLVFGLLFGMLIALIFHNFILYLNLRQRGHLFYVLAMASVLLLLGVDSGLLQNYVLPGFLLAHVAKLYAVFNMLALVTIGLFFLSFVHPHRHAPRLTRAVHIVIGVIALIAIAASILPYDRLPLIITALQPVQLVFQILLIAGAFLSGRRGATEGYIFLAAWLVFIISGFARVFMSLDLVPRTDLFEYLIYFGSVVEASILALGLTWRVRQLYERHARAIEEQHRAARLANLDPLTDAYNRRFLQAYLDGVMPGASADSFDRAVLILDLDHFKETNDEYGHAAGDLVLRKLVRRCRRVLREGDVICRLGGDEFVIVLSDQNDRTGLQVARRIIEEVAERPFLFEGADMPVTTSIGVVSSISPTCSVSDILRMADQALYQAKQAGRNRAVLFDPDRSTPFRRGPSRAPAAYQES